MKSSGIPKQCIDNAFEKKSAQWIPGFILLGFFILQKAYFLERM
jgi:hypothetical protein